MFSVLTWVVFGLIVGFVARYFHPGDEPYGVLATVFLGLGGCFVGGSINYLISGSFQARPAGFFMSVIGTIIIFAFLRWFSSRYVK
jgi:uncharacterized membrane protein YeaQ/YmgE (transglycosylase-associated protein family)